MAKLICGKHNKKMEKIRSGVYVIEYTEKGDPYKVWSADEFRCPVCVAPVPHISDFGGSALYEHYETKFDKHVQEILDNGDYFIFNN